MARQADIHQYRFTADKIIDAVRPPASARDDGVGVVPHDMDFYVVSVARLRELIRKAAHRLQLPGASELLDDFDADLPHVKLVRDWLMHPAEVNTLGMASSFSDVIYRLEPTMLVDADDAQPLVESHYERICTLLGELPER